ncbi:MAG: transglycosylase SLT domain-containing protein [Azospirillaceae bacterium]
MWSAARGAADRASATLPAKVLRWMEMRRNDTTADFGAIAAFIEANPDWPGLTRLRLQAERALPETLPAVEVARWFDAYPAQTFDALMAHMDALDALDRRADADAIARTRWIDLPVTPAQQGRFLARFGAVLGPEAHAARLDALIWAERLDEARRMLALVDAATAALGTARIKLAARESGVDAAIEAVPAALADDEGLLWERLRWRRYYDFNEGAAEILDRQPTDAAHPDAWWQERNILIRRAMEDGDHALAYRLAAAHRQTEGFPLAQAEWLAGWTALRRLDRPAAAFDHFTRLHENVGTPISLSRGAYWAGRAAAAQGDEATARQWYQRAAAHSASFYGQLAAGELGLPTVTGLPPDPTASADAVAEFAGRERVRVVADLRDLGLAGDTADPFLFSLLLDASTAEDYALLNALAADVDRPDIAVAASRRAVFDDVIYGAAAYPTAPLPQVDPRPERALILGLIRQESGFDLDAVSRAGALGLMQLMPATARDVAADLGVPAEIDRLTRDAAYNIRFGSVYLGDRLAEFDGSYIAAVAGYNAGPNRVARWLGSDGDPRAGRMDLYAVIDWIESIPIYETRNYVQRVLEATQVYRRRLGEAPEIGTLEADLRR